MLKALFGTKKKPAKEPLKAALDWRELPSNKEYLAVVNDRVLRLFWEVIREYQSLGLEVWGGSYLYHEELIRIAYMINPVQDDLLAKERIRMIIRKYVHS